MKTKGKSVCKLNLSQEYIKVRSENDWKLCNSECLDKQNDGKICQKYGILFQVIYIHTFMTPKSQSSELRPWIRWVEVREECR